MQITFSQACKEYISSRSNDKVFCAWLIGSLTAVGAAILTNNNNKELREIDNINRENNNNNDKEKEETNKEEKEEISSTSTFRKFMFLLRIAMPLHRLKESRMLFIISVLLLLRTYLSLRISVMSGKLSKILLLCDLNKMFKSVILFMLWCIPTVITNSSMNYFLQMLALQMQLNLGNYFHKNYLNNNVFFSLASANDNNNNIKEVDQRITRDIERWSNSVTNMYTSLFKPIIDIIIFSLRVGKLGGGKSPALVMFYYTGFATISYLISPDMEYIINEFTKREGTLVTSHQRLIPFTEEIVMTQGQTFHFKLMKNILNSIIQHGKYSAYIRGLYGLFETFFIKYGSTILGYIVCGAAVFSSENKNMSTEDLTGVFVESTYMFRNLAFAVGQLLGNIKTFFIVRALTHRVYTLQEAISKSINSNNNNNNNNNNNIGEIIRGEYIEFDRVPLILPTGKILCKELSFYVRPGMNLLIIGPNGCGKTSLIRYLGEIWKIKSGKIIKPRNDQIYFLPQRPYMSSGSLRDQITYPLKSNDIGVSESILLNCLEMAMLDDIFLKPNITWDSSIIFSSNDILSMGEKQKLAMARLFFHKPRFAILDECSSQMDIEIEERLYNMCRYLGISLITIAHRHSTWKYHNYILRFDGFGEYMFAPVIFEENDKVILTRVVNASNSSIIGQEVRLDLSQYNE